MSANHRPSYVTLVAALRNEFNDMQRSALWIQMRKYRYDVSSLSTLAQAVHDAQNPTYQTGMPGLTDRIAQAIGDPGSILPRLGRDTDNPESVTSWSTRAVEAVLAGGQDTPVRAVETVHLPSDGGDGRA